MTLTREQALDCLRSDDLIGLGMEADAVRRRLHPEGVVSYVVEVGDELAAEAQDLGATGLVLRGAETLAELETRLATLRERFPALWVGGLSATAVLRVAGSLGIEETLRRLQSAGLRSLGGWDAQVLADGFRRGGCSVEDWLAVHRAAHLLGLPTAATMTFGQGESDADRVTHLELLARLQAETGGFRSFTPAGHLHNVAAGERSLEEATSVEYLKVLAVCRMQLESIANLQANWPTQGVKVLQMGLRFGANDVGAAGLEPGTSEEDLRRTIRDAGFRPIARDSSYGVMFLG